MSKSEGLPELTLEHRFHPGRKFRLDGAYLEAKLAIEIEGGQYSRTITCQCGQIVKHKGKVLHVGGGHQGSRFLSDIEKYCELSIMGWSLLRCTPAQVKDGTMTSRILRWFKARENNNANTD